MCFHQLCELGDGFLESAENVFSRLSNCCGLIVQLIQNQLRKQMVLLDEKVIRGLAMHAEFFEAGLGKVSQVLGDDSIRSSHDGSREHMAVVLIWNAIDSLQEFGWN